MSLAAVAQRGPRMTLVNLATLQRLVANAHPPVLAWRTILSWSKHEVPGRSSVPLQYGHTQNPEVSSLELAFDRRLPESAGGTRDLKAAEKFLQALTLPAAGAPGVPKAPPSVLVVWPNLISIEGVVTSLSIEYRDIGVDGRPLLVVATLGVEGVSTPAGEQARSQA